MDARRHHAQRAEYGHRRDGGHLRSLRPPSAWQLGGTPHAPGRTPEWGARVPGSWRGMGLRALRRGGRRAHRCSRACIQRAAWPGGRRRRWPGIHRPIRRSASDQLRRGPGALMRTPAAVRRAATVSNGDDADRPIGVDAVRMARGEPPHHRDAGDQHLARSRDRAP
jgi:hypothetical protein